MAAELGHQAAARAIPQPPANQFFERCVARGRSSLLGFIAVFRADDFGDFKICSAGHAFASIFAFHSAADFTAFGSFSALASSLSQAWSCSYKLVLLEKHFLIARQSVPRVVRLPAPAQ